MKRWETNETSLLIYGFKCRSMTTGEQAVFSERRQWQKKKE